MICFLKIVLHTLVSSSHAPRVFHLTAAAHPHLLSPRHRFFQPLKELPPPGQLFKDKFLVQACQTTEATDDAKAIFETTDKEDIIDQKLMCTFNLPGVDTSAHEPNDSVVNATARDTFESNNSSAIGSTSLGTSIEEPSPTITKPNSKALRAAAPAPPEVCVCICVSCTCVCSMCVECQSLRMRLCVCLPISVCLCLYFFSVCYLCC